MKQKKVTAKSVGCETVSIANKWLLEAISVVKLLL